MTAPPAQWSVARIAREVRAGTLEPGAPIAAAEAAWRAADAGPHPVHAFLSADFQGALERARRLDAEHPQRAGGALRGVPVAVKDNLATLDFPTTCGSRILQGYRSPYEATVVRRLQEAGAVLVGKTNLDEFAMGSSTEYSAFGPTRNPLDHSRVPGGSSGGSAAAVRAGIVPAALGSETGGSVRQPAAFCGVVGIKPTYGRVSRYGLIAFASSLDQVGVLGRRVEDAAALLQAVAGHDPRDAISAALPAPDLLAECGRGVEGMVVGVPREYYPDSLEAPVRDACRAALRHLQSLGVRLREVSLAHTPHAVPTYYIVAPAEASSNLARFDGVHFGARPPGMDSVEQLYQRTRALFGPEVKRRVMLGTYVLSAGHRDAYYARAQRVRARIADDFRGVFQSGVDALFTPTTPGPAFRLGERTADPYAMYLSDAFTVGASLVGVPALSLPIGAAGGLPLGGQLIGPHWSEGPLVRLACALQESLASEQSVGGAAGGDAASGSGA